MAVQAAGAGSTCTKCSGSGFVITESEGIRSAELCSCRAAAVARDSWDRAGIPPLYQNASCDNFMLPPDNPLARRDLATVLIAVRSFIREFPAGDKPGLLFAGDTGTGKTHLAVAALRALLARGHVGAFFDYQTMLERLRPNLDRGESSDKDVFDTAMNIDVLLLDDLGAHRATDWTEDTITSIITHRCNHRKALIATTNLADPDMGSALLDKSNSPGGYTSRLTLGERIGMRARSRLFEMCRVIRMPAVEDFRLRKNR